MAAETDVAPSKILRDRDLVALAQSRVQSSDSIMTMLPKLARAESARLFRAHRKASRLSEGELPTRREAGTTHPRSSLNHTDIKDRVAALKAAMAELASEHSIPHDVLLQPAIVKSLGAQSRIDVEQVLVDSGARPWQVELSAPVLANTMADLDSA